MPILLSYQVHFWGVRRDDTPVIMKFFQEKKQVKKFWSPEVLFTDEFQLFEYQKEASKRFL